MRPIRKILVANRGEIAVRIFRTAREMGIGTVAVYSEPDAGACHTRFADEAFLIGPAAPGESYLRIGKIIDTALRSGADAVHPGYGFLSENAVFAQAVLDAGLTFIGPSPSAIRTMGSKLEAKRAAALHQVPLVPGIQTPVADPAEAVAVARDIGFPLLIKASAGGGGKGMRLVTHQDELHKQLERAQSEAFSAFGDASVFLERYITRPRHIEFQIVGDNHGNLVHLFERECSIQRRHQKLIEEAPSSLLTPELREAMGQAAIRVARACGYTNAGTVEFIVDPDGGFYFLEMNTRLQVEHPVTELITGVDLVRLQIEIAQGKPLGFRQSDLSIRGHAIEARICSENPFDNFLPDAGLLRQYELPAGPGVRVDNGYHAGQEVSIHYDPLLAKLIVHAGDRSHAIERMIRALDEYTVSGIHTTIPFCRFAVDHPAFRSGDFDTGFVAHHFKPDEYRSTGEHPYDERLAIAAALHQWENGRHKENLTGVKPESSWRKNRLEL